MVSSYAIFVGFPADDWRGPELVRWEPGLIEKDYIALRAGEADGEDDANRWVGCALGDVEEVRWCALNEGEALSCFQAEISVRTAGTVYAYVSRPCLTYLEGQGIAVSQMDAADTESCRTLWSELAEEEGNLTAEVCGIVNASLN